MTGGEMRSGVATYGYPRRRPVTYEPIPTIHQPCGTDRERGDCPDECPPETREETR
ncbi:hypothetical protein O7626_40340 [Micromonospora sp. WMMD1102]|uniref:hypothetical protein n=1 Tax=Micromonospora sp. WMMD1102 TaxID=3016105 RepID=UPI002415008A|nr:hypothetical protein [Micromonospora sp. WMMD1102]MDG4792068.1 hypothetical protein [Micromonospora sp. WMMD1102]